MDSKAWYMSTKIWIAIIGVIGGLSASLSGVEALTIPGIVGAVLSALVAVLRIIEGKDRLSTEQPIRSPIPYTIFPVIVAALLLWTFPSCSGVQKQDAKPYVDAAVDAVAIVACGPMIEAWCGEGRPLHESNACADWKQGCALAIPIVAVIADALTKSELAPGSIRGDDFARACDKYPLPLCDHVGAGESFVILPGE